MADKNNGNNTIPKKCIDISNKFIKAIDKFGIFTNLMILKSSEPENHYELLYGQAKQQIADDIQFKVLLQMNPPEDVYKDLHMEIHGDAIVEIMSYSIQKVGIIGNTLLDYFNIPTMLLGNHLRFGNDYYRIDEVKQTDVFMGFPLHLLCVVTFIETKCENGFQDEESGEL